MEWDHQLNKSICHAFRYIPTCHWATANRVDFRYFKHPTETNICSRKQKFEISRRNYYTTVYKGNGVGSRERFEMAGICFKSYSEKYRPGIWFRVFLLVLCGCIALTESHSANAQFSFIVLFHPKWTIPSKQKVPSLSYFHVLMQESFFIIIS